nr:hypothetical protein [uncultured Kingella sp.]
MKYRRQYLLIGSKSKHSQKEKQNSRVRAFALSGCPIAGAHKTDSSLKPAPPP